MSEFRRAVEARAIDSFWDSRKKSHLRSKPEKVAQALLALFAKGVVGGDGLVLREFLAGIGFVDLGISFGKTLHLIELKIVRTKLDGIGQLSAYMRTENRREGWLVLFDARTNRDEEFPAFIDLESGRIRTQVVDINPIPPHLAP